MCRYRLPINIHVQVNSICMCLYVCMYVDQSALYGIIMMRRQLSCSVVPKHVHDWSIHFTQSKQLEIMLIWNFVNHRLHRLLLYMYLKLNMPIYLAYEWSFSWANQDHVTPEEGQWWPQAQVSAMVKFQVNQDHRVMSPQIFCYISLKPISSPINE